MVEYRQLKWAHSSKVAGTPTILQQQNMTYHLQTITYCQGGSQCIQTLKNMITQNLVT